MPRMKDEAARALRKKNLNDLLGPDRGSIVEFCKGNALDVSEISGLRKGHRAFTEGQARKIEHEKKLPTGYLDNKHGGNSAPGSLEHIESSIKQADWLDDESKQYFIWQLHKLKAPKSQED